MHMANFQAEVHESPSKSHWAWSSMKEKDEKQNRPNKHIPGTNCFSKITLPVRTQEFKLRFRNTLIIRPNLQVKKFRDTWQLCQETNGWVWCCILYRPYHNAKQEEPSLFKYSEVNRCSIGTLLIRQVHHSAILSISVTTDSWHLIFYNMNKRKLKPKMSQEMSAAIEPVINSQGMRISSFIRRNRKPLLWAPCTGGYWQLITLASPVTGRRKDDCKARQIMHVDQNKKTRREAPGNA